MGDKPGDNERVAFAQHGHRIVELGPRAVSTGETVVEIDPLIGEALHVVAASDLRLADEVIEARANGRTWTQIAAVLGVSKQAARERFGESARR